MNLTFEKPDGSRVSINLLRGTADYIAEILRAENEGRPPPPAPAQERQYHPPSAHDPSPNLAHVPGTVVQDDSSLAAAVGVSLSLDEDYDSLVTAPERLQAFNVQFKQDLAHAVDCNTGRIQLVGLQVLDYISTFVCVCVCVCVCLCAAAGLCECTQCVRVFSHTYTHKRIGTYVHARIHARTTHTYSRTSTSVIALAAFSWWGCRRRTVSAICCEHTNLRFEFVLSSCDNARTR